MGITISKHASLAPISLASTIIGFISFAVTLVTWLGIFWSDIMTLGAAPSEIPDFLGNLKQGLYEERAHLRRVHSQLKRRGSSAGRTGYRDRDRDEKYPRRRSRQSRRDEEMSEEAVSNRVMRDAIRHMIRSFREIERPFLKDTDPRSGKNNRSTRDKEGWDTEGYGYGYGADEEEDLDYARTAYRECGLKERYMWLKKKSSVRELLQALSRVQTRRIAQDLGYMFLKMRDMDNKIEGLEQRLSRVVGVRRIE